MINLLKIKNLKIIINNIKLGHIGHAGSRDLGCNLN